MEDNNILSRVLAAQDNMSLADKLIKDYKPFIKAQASKATNKSIGDSDDEFSIAMIGFHEAIRAYDKKKGGFLNFASIIIKNRIIDFYRKESRHLYNDSLDQTLGEEDIALIDTIEGEKNELEEKESLAYTQAEIFELRGVLEDFGVSLTDIAENSPKQDRTLEACRQVVQFAIDNPIILEDIARTGKLPITLLAERTKVQKKTLERHRKYILAMMIIQTNGFEIIRDHLKEVLSLGKGGAV